MKIYTKTGDRGQTSLIGGTRVPKHHLRIEAYGTVDELNSYVGLIRDLAGEKSVCAPILLKVQDRLFTIGATLASDPQKSRMKIPDLHDADITLLETEIDTMNEALPELKTFILPGGHIANSNCHIARCVCRRAERMVTHLNEQDEVDEKIIRYLNRLSDYMFVLARKLSFDNNAPEIAWNPVKEG